MFLVSRYGIVVSEDEVTETIMKGFGGGGISEADGNLMDLTELVAMLLIPTLVRTKRGMKTSVDRTVEHTGTVDDADNIGSYRVGHGNVVDDFDNNKAESARTVDYGVRASAGQSGVVVDTNESFVVRDNTNPSTHPKGANKKLFQSVLQMILADTVHDTSSPPALTVDLLRSIFLFYGEKEVAVDTDLLQSMVDLAKDVGGVLSDRVFAHCLTSDVELYDTDWENKLQSTYVDVFETHESTKKKKSMFSRQSCDDDVESSQLREEEGGQVNEVLKRYTFPAIDYAVDTFRSKTYVIVVRFICLVDCFLGRIHCSLGPHQLWFTWVLFYMNFIGILGSTNNELGDLDCDQYPITTAKGFFCGVGQGVVNWLRVMFKLV